MSYPLSAAAEQALRAARATALFIDVPEATPEILLLCLLHHEGTMADRLLGRLGISPQAVRDSFPELESARTRAGSLLSGHPPQLGRELSEVLAKTWAQRRDTRWVGTDHLLLALAESQGAAGAALVQIGATPDLLRQGIAAERLLEQTGQAAPRPWHEAYPQNYQPMAVHAAAAFLLLHALCCMVPECFSSLTAPASDYGGLYPALLFASMLWTLGCGIALPGGLGDREPWAWSAAAGFLFVKAATASWQALALAILSARSPNAIPGLAALAPLCYDATVVAVWIGLFRVREWFGVERRRGWNEIRRRGWWAALITLVLELALAFPVTH